MKSTVKKLADVKVGGEKDAGYGIGGEEDLKCKCGRRKRWEELKWVGEKGKRC